MKLPEIAEVIVISIAIRRLHLIFALDANHSLSENELGFCDQKVSKTSF